MVVLCVACEDICMYSNVKYGEIVLCMYVCNVL